MDITFITEYFPPFSIGGAEISTYYLAKELAKKHNITVITQGEGEETDDGFKIKRIKELKINSKMYNIFEKRFINKMINILKSESKNTDILHGHDLHSTMPLTFAPFCNKSVATIRDYWPICGSRKLLLNNYAICDGCCMKNLVNCLGVKKAPLPLKIIYPFFYKCNVNFRLKQFRNLKSAVGISKFISRIIETKTHQNISTIHNPIPPEWLYVKKIPYNTNRILYVGRLDESKGLSVLFKAFKLVLKEGKCKLVLAGPGDINLYRKMAKKMRIYNRVSFLGNVNHFTIKEIYKNSDVLVNPSLWPEPFGRTLIEAMSLKKPVIATNQGGCIEVIQNGKTGYLIPPKNERALAEKILLILNDVSLQKKLGKNGREYARAHFHPKIIAERYVQVYQNVLNFKH